MRKINIAKIMIPKVFTAFLHENDSVRQGLEVMTNHGYTAIPVLDEQERYLGSISEGDFLRHIMTVGDTDKRVHEQYRIGTIMRKDFCPAIRIEADQKQVISAILNQNFVPIIDDRNVLCGILTRKGVIEYLDSLLPDEDDENRG